MNELHTTAVAVIVTLVVVDAMAVAYILVAKLSYDRFRKMYTKIATQLVKDFPQMNDEAVLACCGSRKKRHVLLECYVESRQSLRIGSAFDNRMKGLLDRMGLRERYLRRLSSLSKFRRIESAVYLGHLGDDEVCNRIENALKIEKSYLVKFYLAHALAELQRESAVMPLAESLIGAPEWYQKRVRMFLGEFGHHLFSTIPLLILREEPEIRLLTVHLASRCPGAIPASFVKEAIVDPDPQIRRAAATALTLMHPNDAMSETLIDAEDPTLQIAAVEARRNDFSRENVDRLLALLRKDAISADVSRVLSGMTNRSRVIREHLMFRYNEADVEDLREKIIEILSNQAEYFVVKLDSPERDTARKVLGDMLDRGLVNNIFGFLARNRQRELENELLALIKQRALENPMVLASAREFLDERMRQKIGITAGSPRLSIPPIRKNAVRKKQLLILLGILVFFFPIFFVLRHLDVLRNGSLLFAVKLYVVDWNYYLIFYSTAVSSIYLVILFFSALGAHRQQRYAASKKKTFLFRRSMLPSISVIGPAFNEEANIIESVNSLLNLRYPDHEVIIVNDGSTDRTLNSLIEYFMLEKVDWISRAGIHTRPIRAVYKNPSHPKLTVVDKLNGGKADSLNTGINLASKEYFCAIDADSLLSEDALLHVASACIDSNEETVAVGGNILPVNGCVVHRGALESIQTPSNVIANFQFTEYLRAFMAGRIGWAYLNSLLIISGAFGIFRRDRVVECGGYLTHAGRYGLDTVGEDMELVVRLTRMMYDKRQRFSVGYAHNANCWTEVPEKMNTLLRQRDRWHRGLIEILSFHRDMIGSPKYGKIGLTAMPYFFLFEILGPWVEVQGYLMLLPALLFGLLNSSTAIWLFIASVMLGVFVSISALIIAEQEIMRFRLRDVLKLFSYAIVENFGFRQLMSGWRIVGYINLLRGRQGWGKMQRRGFTSSIRRDS